MPSKFSDSSSIAAILLTDCTNRSLPSTISLQLTPQLLCQEFHRPASSPQTNQRLIRLVSRLAFKKSPRHNRLRIKAIKSELAGTRRPAESGSRAFCAAGIFLGQRLQPWRATTEPLPWPEPCLLHHPLRPTTACPLKPSASCITRSAPRKPQRPRNSPGSCNA